MSNIENTTSTSKNSVFCQQLFTELTPEEGAVIEGGATLRLTGIYCKTAGADGDGSDELYINMKTLDFDKKVWGNHQFFSKEGLTFTKNIKFSGNARLTLYDNDKWPNPDDKIGNSFEVSAYKPGNYIKEVSGAGSHYTVSYTVIA